MATRKYAFQLTGISDLMFGKHVQEKKKADETHEQFEERTWQQKVHVNQDGQCFIPPFALKNALESAGKWLSMKIPGEAKKTYTDRFKKAVLVVNPMVLTKPGTGEPVTMEDVDPNLLLVPSTGKRGQGTRVARIFPTVYQWRATGDMFVFDGKITDEVIQKHLQAVGQFIGFGSMRVEGGGINGRFSVDSLEMVEELEGGDVAA